MPNPTASPNKQRDPELADMRSIGETLDEIIYNLAERRGREESAERSKKAMIKRSKRRFDDVDWS